MERAQAAGGGDSFFAFPPDVRRVIDTTNALENVHARIRKVIKTRGHFPNDDAATKLIWLALRNITAEWRRPAHHWRCDESIRDPVRRSLHDGNDLKWSTVEGR